MGFSDKALLTLYRAGSRLLLGSGDNADWIYEKVQRPGNTLALARNMAYYYLLARRIPTIFSLMVEPVLGCNLRCQYCPWSWEWVRERLEGLRPRLMPWQLFQKIIDEAPKSVESVTFAGLGEPLLHPRLSEMFDYCAQSGLRSVVYTNGTLLTGDTLKRLASSRLSVLTLSVETDAEAAQELRGVDNAVIRGNLEAFLELKRPETQVKLSVVAYEGYADRFENTRQEWETLITSVKVNPLMGLEGRGSPQVCMEPWRGNVFVLTDGQVTPCCIDYLPELGIGNLNEQSFGDILHGEAFREILKRLVTGKAPKRCLECSELTTPSLPRKAPKRKPRLSS